MALTLTPIRHPYVVGDRWEATWIAAADSSYSTGGYSLTQVDLGFSAAVDPEFLVTVDNLMGYGAKYDYAAQKLLLYSSGSTQVTAATDLSAILTDISIRATGKLRS